MKKFFLVLLMLIISITVSAQQHAWENLLESLMDEQEDGGAGWENAFDVLCDMEEHPLEINTASREDLQRIPFLTDQQIEELCAYLYQYGGMKSLGELALIESLDLTRRQLLSYFIYIDNKPEDKHFPSLKNIAKYGRNNLLLTGKIPCYRRKGDREGYLGYPYRHSLRYSFNYSDFVQIGMTGSQDAGEPFFTDRNKAGYDHYSLYLVIRKWGRLKTLAVGHYKLKFGMGLVMNNDFSFGKTATLSTLGSSNNSIRAYSSRSAANYLQGAAATVTVAKGLDITGFISYRKIDATLNTDKASIATILSNNYHRTEAEMDKKNNVSETCGGGNVHFFKNGFHVGLTAVYNSFNLPLKPKTTQRYRLYYPAGKNFWNGSIDYGYISHRLSFSGETATGNCRALATINKISYLPSSNLQLLLVHRFYSHKYYAIHAESFNDGGRVQNENGAYLGIVWQPFNKMKIMAYTDYTHFAWEKYQASAPSGTWDNMISASYAQEHYNITARYQFKLQEKDNKQKTKLINDITQKGRLSFAWHNDSWNLKTQADCSWNRYKQESFGWMIHGVVSWQSSGKRIQVSAVAGYFHTEDYQSRIYLYERGALYQFYFPSFYGHGIHYSLFLRADISAHVMALGKVATSNYFDRDHLSSGLQQINHSSMTDLELQVKWKF